MGSSSSGLGSPPPHSPRPNLITRTISSLFVCGASTSHAPLETGDDPAELRVNSAEHVDPVVDDFRSPTTESALISSAGTGFTSPKAETVEDSASEDGLSKVETNNGGKCLSESKELVPPHQLYADSASTSYENRSSSYPITATERVNISVSNGVHNVNGPHEPRDSIADGFSTVNHASEVTDIQGSGFNPVFDSSLTFHSLGNHTLQEAISSGRRDDTVLHVDLVSIASDNLSSSSTAVISSCEARWNSRTLFWDAFSRRSSRRRSDSTTFLFSNDDIDDRGSRDRWLLDISGDFFGDGAGGDLGYPSSRTTHSTNERRQQSRSEMRERLRGGLDGRNRRTSFCPSGLHPDGTCSCELILTGEEPSTHASISRIVMLAEALFEVLDEIHRQPLSLSLSMVSLPAPGSVVDSFPVKNHRKPDTSESGDDVTQCYICLAEYENGDKIRVLPCHHEYHMSCVDKWLKEIHGVCPLCRGDVREGFTESSVTNSEISSI